MQTTTTNFTAAKNFLPIRKTRKIMQDINEQIEAFHGDYPELLVEYNSLSTRVYYPEEKLQEIARVLLHETISPYARDIALRQDNLYYEVKPRKLA